MRLIIFRDPRLQFNNAFSFISLINNKNTVNSSKNYKINNLHDVQQPISNISPGLEIVENLDASGAIDGNEGRQTTPTDLAQAIVADREFIAKISSAIWANIAQISTYQTRLAQIQMHLQCPKAKQKN